jgi:hypothetical protein
VGRLHHNDNREEQVGRLRHNDNREEQVGRLHHNDNRAIVILAGALSWAGLRARLLSLTFSCITELEVNRAPGWLGSSRNEHE